MSDNPQSETERNRLLEDQTRLMKAQQHLERVLGGGVVDNADHEMGDAGPQAVVGGSAPFGMMSGGRTMKTENSSTPQTPGISHLEAIVLTSTQAMLTDVWNIAKRKRSPETISL
jgi:hypothetical protein